LTRRLLSYAMNVVTAAVRTRSTARVLQLTYQ
jgi:hypothetical protein